MEPSTLVNQFGLPIGLLLFFIWQNYQINKEHKADMRAMAEKATTAANAAADGLVKSASVIERSNNILSRVEGVLSTRGGD